jgi:flavin-dependent dehydrogenase
VSGKCPEAKYDLERAEMGANTDVLVIGGGPAGLAAAIAARQRGFSVTVADGAEPPIDKACGEGLMPDSLAAFSRLGLGLSASDGSCFRGIRFLNEGVQLEANFPFAHGLGVSRRVLHHKMIEHARQMGVTLWWRTPVTGLCSGGATAAGENVTARWIVGADGIRSRVRRWASLDRGSKSSLRYACRRHYTIEPWSDYAEIYWGRDAQAYVTPVSSREVCVVLISGHTGISLASLAKEFPQFAECLSCAGSVDRERGAVTMSFRLDRVCKGNIALIGDASGAVDAITGDGLCLSFQQADALAAALEVGDLSLYQIAHRRLARRPALMSRLLLFMDRHPLLRRRALRVMAAEPRLFARLLAVHVGAGSSSQLAALGAQLGWRLVAA